MNGKNNRNVFFMAFVGFFFAVLLCVFPCNIVFADDIVSDASEISSETTLEGAETVSEDETVVFGEADGAVDDFVSNGLVFEPLGEKSDGTVTLEDLYNVMVRLYNFSLMAFIVALMVWTYNMLTSAFRRFLYR